jgi:hypothetical protein
VDEVRPQDVRVDDVVTLTVYGRPSTWNVVRVTDGEPRALFWGTKGEHGIHECHVLGYGDEIAARITRITRDGAVIYERDGGK